MAGQDKNMRGCCPVKFPRGLLFTLRLDFWETNFGCEAIWEDSMKCRQLFLVTLLLSFPVHIVAQTKEPLKLVATIPLPGLKDGDFDHFAPDVEGHRLFLTDEENDKVDVLDTATNARIHTIEDAKAPHAILFRE